jgi:hypothetical protein
MLVISLVVNATHEVLFMASIMLPRLGYGCNLPSPSNEVTM